MKGMEKFINQGLLFDFYGQLLTPHQQRIYQEAVFDDFSISEIAASEGITRQGVSDLIKRCDRSLQEYEEKLGLIQKFRKTKELILQIQGLSRKYRETGEDNLVARIEEIAGEILDL